MQRHGLKAFTIETFDEITGQLRSVNGRAKERRKEPRAGVLGEVDVVAMTADGPKMSRARVRDISRHGISILMNAAPRLDQPLLVRLPAHENGNSVQFTCTVAYCLPPAGGIYQVGTRIDKSAPIDDHPKSGTTTPATAPTAVKVGAVKAGVVKNAEQVRIASAILD